MSSLCHPRARRVIRVVIVPSVWSSCHSHVCRVIRVVVVPSVWSSCHPCHPCGCRAIRVVVVPSVSSVWSSCHPRAHRVTIVFVVPSRRGGGTQACSGRMRWRVVGVGWERTTGVLAGGRGCTVWAWMYHVGVDVYEWAKERNKVGCCSTHLRAATKGHQPSLSSSAMMAVGLPDHILICGDDRTWVWMWMWTIGRE